MKNLHSLVFITMGLFCLLAVACRKDKDDDNLYRATNAPITGAQESPAVTTTGSGSFNATYNPASKEMNITISWQGLTGNATLMHIHGPADRGTNAGVLQNFATLFAAAPSGSFSTSFVLNGTTQTEADLLGGKWYVNIHTAAHPGGEIRGQIELTN
ncbi:CHRD domain-containing protein [Chitinophaga sp. XS-30]|uniref:CHRD domain-containing protein n=1 Tax=Chitinophaga sp. XS-30 TaxID=2604421 RepID=UPI00143D3317|nr:CHRD domain-containing protein [Chitinophaga sp. XS-30]